MPQLARIMTTDDLATRGRASKMDLGAYTAIIEQIVAAGGVGGSVVLGPGEDTRTEKGRLTRAATATGRRLVWRKAPAGELRFVLAEPGEPVPGARPRRPRAEVAVEQTAIDPVATPEVVNVTDTQAPETERPKPARRGRTRKAS